MHLLSRTCVCWAARVASVASFAAHQTVQESPSLPRLIIVHPPPGVSIPSTNPTLVVRYGAGDVSDPLDLRTLVVLVDGVDRTPHFHVTSDVAWGPIIDGSKGISAHEVEARLCTVRGACAEARAVVTVVAPTVRPSAPATRDRRGKAIDLMLEAARRLLRP